MTNIRINSGILIVSLLLLGYSYTVKQMTGSTLDSMNWPRAILVMIIIFSLASLLRAIYDIKKQPVQRKLAISKTSKTSAMSKSSMMGFLPIIAAFCYILGIGYLGYFLASLIFIPLIMYLLGERKLIKMIGTPLIFSVVIWVVFVQFANLLLPAGKGIFRNLSHLIMFGS